MSINQQFVLDSGGEASEDLAEYIGVVIDASDSVSKPAATGDRITGVTQRRAGSGEETQVVLEGIVPIKIATAGSLAVNDYVTANTDGEFLALTTNDEAGARLLQAPAADGDVVTAYVSPGINEQGA